MRILGIDVGTQGVRGIACGEDGRVYAEASRRFASFSTSANPDYKEQRPQDWADAAMEVIEDCVANAGGPIDAVAVDGTSGTVLAIDENMRPLTHGILYNDARSKVQADRVHRIAGEHEKAHGYVFNASYALPKILWVMENQPEIYEKARLVINQADYIVGMLTGVYDVTDCSNALKTGYDLIGEKWPDFIEQIGLDREKLPSVVAPGARIGVVNATAAQQTGLSEHTVVYAGATDGYASSLAAGLALPGEWATVIGTTMVLKGITKKLVLDPEGRIYSHKHPQGWWLPGGASNVGGRCLNEMFGKENFDAYNKTVPDYTPTGCVAYPLTVKGERFPFVRPDAEGFYIGDETDIRRKYAAVMEGVGYTERLCYDLLVQLGCEVGDVVLTSGGAAKSKEWLQIRADIMGKALRVPESTEAAMGSAMIAASGACGAPLSEVVQKMVRFRTEIMPSSENKVRYDEYYGMFVSACRERGYIG